MESPFPAMPRLVLQFLTWGPLCAALYRLVLPCIPLYCFVFVLYFSVLLCTLLPLLCTALCCFVFGLCCLVFQQGVGMGGTHTHTLHVGLGVGGGWAGALCTALYSLVLPCIPLYSLVFVLYCLVFPCICFVRFVLPCIASYCPRHPAACLLVSCSTCALCIFGPASLGRTITWGFLYQQP